MASFPDGVKETWRSTVSINRISLRILALSFSVETAIPWFLEMSLMWRVIDHPSEPASSVRMSRWFWLRAFAKSRAMPILPSSDIGGTLPFPSSEGPTGNLKRFGQADLTSPLAYSKARKPDAPRWTPSG